MPDLSNRRILVLVPCHNEEGRIGPVVSSIRRHLPSADIVIINDDSTDGTEAEARSAGASVLRHPVNLGYGAALETGYLYALKRGYDIVLQMDGDGQHLAEELPLLLGPIEQNKADMVIGSRYLANHDSSGSSILRKLGHKLFSLVILLLTRLRLSDPTSGFQSLDKKAISLFSRGIFPCDFPDSDVILMAHMAGIRIREVPVKMVKRSGGTSMHAGLHPLYYGIKMFLSIFVVLLNFRLWKKIGATFSKDSQS